MVEIEEVKEELSLKFPMTTIQQERWEPDWSSPFTTTCYDLCRFYFFNYYMKEGKFCTARGLHTRLHNTYWFPDNECPGFLIIKMWHKQWKEQIS